MRREKRSFWYLWTCDLDDCEVYATTHPKELVETTPPGWEFIEPPAYWRGPALAFCSTAHRDRFVQQFFLPLLPSGQ